MTTMIAVRPVTADEQQHAIQTLVLAFSNDPFMRWMLPDPKLYLDTFADLATALGGQAFEEGTAFCAGDFVAASLWLPSGVHADEAEVGALMERLPAARAEAMLSIGEELDRSHPVEPHWYLPLIGVDPAHQGRGHGSALLQRALETCDAAHQPAYLESSSERNIPLYERFGFEVVGRVQAGDSPPLWPMVRRAR